MNIGKVVTRHARFRPDHTAFIFEGKRSSYAEFNRSVNQVANAFYDSGIRKGEKVATLLSNCAELWETYWAVAKIGAVAVPLSPLLRGRGLSNLINNADTSLVITDTSIAPYLTDVLGDLKNIRQENVWLIDSRKHPHFDSFHRHKEQGAVKAPPAVDIHPDDLYNIIYSSGTTGAPKGIMHTHRIRAMYMSLFSNYFRINPESIILHTGSIIFNGSFLTIMPVMFQGATFILHSKFDVEELVRTIKEEKVTHTILVPSQITAALQHPGFSRENISSLEMILSVGAPLHQKHKEEVDRRAPGVFYELYGLTEGFVTILDKTDFHKKMGSVGAPPPFFEMRIVDNAGQDVPTGTVGEIIGKGPILMSGYYNQPDLTRQAIRDGWLYSGDLGYTDEDGYLYLVDRKKDLIISGGANVYPKDIEGILVRHPAISEAAVFGVPDDKWGETPVAAIVLKRNQHLDPQEIRNWANERVDARYQRISQVIILQEFPRSVAGKTLKRVIKQQFLENRK